MRAGTLHAVSDAFVSYVLTLQGMSEFLLQGKHYAATQGRGHFADDEVLDLPGMYAAADNPQSITELVDKVRIFTHACTDSVVRSRCEACMLTADVQVHHCQCACVSSYIFAELHA
jgi:hypothetical protein